jgi:hypothetical protein
MLRRSRSRFAYSTTAPTRPGPLKPHERLGVGADAVAGGAAGGEGDVEDDMTPPRRAFPSVAVLLMMSGAAEFPPWVITNQDRDRVAGR